MNWRKKISNKIMLKFSETHHTTERDTNKYFISKYHKTFFEKPPGVALSEIHISSRAYIIHRNTEWSVWRVKKNYFISIFRCIFFPDKWKSIVNFIHLRIARDIFPHYMHIWFHFMRFGVGNSFLKRFKFKFDLYIKFWS